MRIYEFSKHTGIPVKEIIEALQAAGFEAKSHMSSLDQAEIAILGKKYKKTIEEKIASAKTKQISNSAKDSEIKAIIEKKKSVEPEKSTEKKKKEVEQKPIKQKFESKVGPNIEQPSQKMVKSEMQIKETSIRKSLKSTQEIESKVEPVKIVEPASNIETVTKVSPKIESVVQTEPIKKIEPIKKVDLVTHSEKRVPEIKATNGESIVLEPQNVADFSTRIRKPINEVILTLLKMGIRATKNQTLNESIIEQLAKHYELEIIKPSATKTDTVKFVSSEGKYIERHPIVVVIGHVDHGKTTLLDYIRKTKVAAREKGGITQHLGAYEATTEHGKIVFLDTPGHEAFSKIRQRGIKIADIAILVVAADDGVMPQTVEAINFAKRTGLPIVVAITKVDKVDKQRVEVIKRELSQHELLPEEWGGSTICVPVSAITGQGIDQLLEMILLQSQMMELQTAVDVPAKGYILESKMEKGRGPVATVLAQYGTINLGDYFISGDVVGRVNALVDSYGKRIYSALPATPVQVSGFEQLARVGELFEVVSKDLYIRARSKKTDVRPSLEKKLVHEGAINLIVKADNNSSQEAIIDAIVKLKSSVGFNIIHTAVGDVNESDIELAADTDATIVGFNVKAELNANVLAQRKNVKIELFDIIYRLLEFLQEQSEAKKEIEIVRKKIGEAVVRQVFDIKNIGVIAGCYVKDGKFTREASVTVFRNNKKVGEGKIKSLQREKKSVKEVHAGFECGFLVDGFDAWQVDDRVDCFIEVPK